MPQINFLIKPASSSCNLRCKYCFYRCEAENRKIASYGIMKEDILEAIVKKGLKFADIMCGFAFQGGEPTLAGLGFFEKLMELERKYNHKGLKIDNSIQTNGTLIDERWARFFFENHFLVGISLDGPKEIHNLNRVDAKNNGSYNRVMKAVGHLNKYHVEYNILSVVTSNTARFANRLYNFYKRNGFQYLQFVSCLDPLDEAHGQHAYSLKPAGLGIFLNQIFDRWYEDFMKGDYVSIRYFDNLISMILGQQPEACNMTGRCQCNCVIEADGGVYPCDFYMLDKWHIGNIRDCKIGDMLNSARAKEFIADSIDLPEKCSECRWQLFCRGGCRREREGLGAGRPEMNYFCDSYKAFFDYSYERLVRVAEVVSGR